jgi:hypothetical protein
MAILLPRRRIDSAIRVPASGRQPRWEIGIDARIHFIAPQIGSGIVYHVATSERQIPVTIVDAG